MNLFSNAKHEIFDFIIVGSGFGGSVTAMRLSQKGYRVLVIEKGRRFNPKDFAKSNWDLKNYLWAPILRCFGIQAISIFDGLMVLHGVGVGGGSLVYGNTLMEPHESCYKDLAWPEGVNWSNELSSHFQTAKKMLGVVKNPIIAEADKELQKLGESLGVGQSFHPTEVGVYFGKKTYGISQSPHPVEKDPYFSGQGPDRRPCHGCGACMVGCRHSSKNTLDQNYLYFAEKWGTIVLPQTAVEKIVKEKDDYHVFCKTSSQIFSKSTVFKAKKVVLAAGALGTLKILFQQKYKYQTLPEISDCLGQDVMTNGESLCGATSLNEDKDYSMGIAIGSAIHTDSKTKIEPVRYPRGSDFMKILAVPLTGEGGVFLRPLKLLLNTIRKFQDILKLIFIKDWASSTIILLVMQSIEQKISLTWGRSFLSGGAKTLVRKKDSKALPSYLPIAQVASQKLAEQIEGVGQNIISEVLLKTPATAHILGGAKIAQDKGRGVVDLQHEVFGAPGLYVCDGSVVPANLGVNPSLTITAMAERFSSQFEVKNETLFAERQIRFTNSANQ